MIGRAIFGAVQLIEMLKNPPGGIEVEASFDEFNLDLVFRYRGLPLTIPDQRPSPRDVMASEEGEQLLAGYLLRRTADRIESDSTGDVAEIRMHYDH